MLACRRLRDRPALRAVLSLLACAAFAWAMAVDRTAPGPGLAAVASDGSALYLPVLTLGWSAPPVPRLVGRTEIRPTTLVAAEGQHAYTVWDGRLAVLEFPDRVPEQVGSTEVLAGTPSDLVARDGYVYAASGSAGLVVVDARSAHYPEIAATLDLGGTAQDLALEGNVAFVTLARRESVGGALVSVDIADPARPRLLGRLGESSGLCAFSDVAAVGRHAFLSMDPCGLWVVDATRPAELRRVFGAVSDVFDASTIAVSAGYAYVGNNDDGVEVYDVRAPTAPRAIGNASASEADFDYPGTS